VCSNCPESGQVDGGGCVRRSRARPHYARLREVPFSTARRGARNCRLSMVFEGAQGTKAPTAPNPPWLGKGKPARETAQATLGGGLVGVTPARSRRAPNICD